MKKSGNAKKKLLAGQHATKSIGKRKTVAPQQNVSKRRRTGAKRICVSTGETSSVGIDSGASILTNNLLSDLEISAFQHFQLSAFKQLCQAFSTVCGMMDEGKESYHKFHIKSAEVYNRLMNIMLFKAHEVFHFHLMDACDKKIVAIEGAAAHFSRSIVRYKHSTNWSMIRPLIRSFMNNYVHIIEKHTDENILVCALKCLNKLMPFVVPLQNLGKKVLRCLVHIWSNNINEQIRLLAFLRIRQLAMNSGHSFTENIMKNLYLSYVRNSKFCNENSIKKIDTMRNCVIELYGLDLKTAYQCAFIYIRQLGIHVRNALKDKTKDARSQVYNFQFLNSIRLWAYMLVHFNTTELQPLCFPLAQIIISCIRLSPSSCFYPFRLHCVELLILLERASPCTTVMPIIPLLLGVFHDSSVYRHHSSRVAKKIPEFQFLLKAAPSQIDTDTFKDLIVTKSLELIESHLSLYKHDFAFPELSFRTITMLKKAQRKLRTPRWSQMVKALTFRLEKWSCVVKSMVESVRYSPSDIHKSTTVDGI